MPKDLRIPDYQGRKTFDFILNQLETCINDILPFFTTLDADIIYTPTFLEEAINYMHERPQIDLIELALCDIAYALVFFGVSYYDITAINRLYEKKYNPLFLTTISFYITKKPHPDANKDNYWQDFTYENLAYILDDLRADLDNIKNGRKAERSYINTLQQVYNVKELSDSGVYRYYGGHQFKLGHYYRHLFQSVKYIDEQKKLTYNEKYGYLKTLRAQLSTPEQYLLFFNTISSLGRAWEFDKIKGEDYQNSNCYLITKYNFIKNVPDTYFINRIQLKNYYPLVNFEFESKNEKREKLEKRFT